MSRTDLYHDGQPLGRDGLFQLVTDEAFRDGILEPWERTIIENLSRFLRLEPSRALTIARLSRERFASGQLGEARPMEPLGLYRFVLTFVLSDGRVDPEEGQMLQGLRILFRLTDAMHSRIEAEVRAQLGLAPGPASTPVAPLDPVALRSVGEAKRSLAGADDARNRGDYPEAESLAHHALALLETSEGRNHPDVATALLVLASVHQAWGRWRDAEPLCIRALGVREVALGEKHPDVAAAMTRLAEIYNAQKNHVLAEQKYLQALEIQEAALGPSHPDVSRTLNALGEIFRVRDRWDQAITAFERALEIRSEALDPQHPDLAATVDNLVWLYRKTGRFGPIEALYEKRIGRLEKALGPDHPVLLKNVQSLAYMYERTRELAKASPLYRRILESKERTHGPDSLETADALADLARLHFEQGSFREAKSLYERVLELRCKLLDGDDIVILATLEGYTVSLLKTQDVPALVKLLEEPHAPSRLYAARTLERLGIEGRTAIPALEHRASHDEAAPVREAALAALKALESRT